MNRWAAAALALLLAGCTLGPGVAPSGPAGPPAEGSGGSVEDGRTSDGRVPGAGSADGSAAGRSRADLRVDTVLGVPIPPLEFDPVEPVEHTLASGVTVFFLRDTSLPLVDIFLRFRGGYGRFGRGYFAPGLAMPAVLRGGGTRELTPDSVDRVVEGYALQTSFGTAGGALTVSMNTLVEHLDPALDLVGGLLAEPGFDADRIQVWRGQQLEAVRRRLDDPARLAYAEFNRLMYGDHPVGWEVERSDLAPDLLTRERFEWLHRRMICPGNLLLGVAGDVTWEELEPRLEALVARLPRCAEALPEPPEARVGAEPGVYILDRPVNQATVVMAHPTDLRQDSSTAWFASRVGNAILGASGFSSRLMGQIRTEEGLAYSVSSLWTTPRRYRGLLGATTRTRTERVAEAVVRIRDIMESMAASPPSGDEVATIVDQQVQGFVFNFESPAQIVARRMALRASELPDDWPSRFLAGFQAIGPADVQQVFRDHLRPDELVILVVGESELLQPTMVDAGLGPVRVLDLPGAGP